MQEEIFDFENQTDVELGENPMVDNPIGVYVKVSDDGFVADVNSDIFIKDFSGWKKIDEGFGDRFSHAQTMYFNEPLFDQNGNLRIKYIEE